ALGLLHPLEQLLLLGAAGVDQLVAEAVGPAVLDRRRDGLALLGLLGLLAAGGILVFGREGGPQPICLAVLQVGAADAARLEDRLAGVGDPAQGRGQVAG